MIGSLGASDEAGSPDGAFDELSEGVSVGVTTVGVGVGVGAAPVSLGVACAELAAGGPEEALGVGRASAIAPGGRVGATIPAVSATVARTRLRIPMATTSRAR
ncbi:MAG TPA: hypothetical protein VM427_08140 [Patescibacteria group bacterium]|nr:hypothetical protein [Patescibacteria group bacterium]